MIPEIPHVPCNPAFTGQAEVIPHVVYSENGCELTLIRPWAVGDEALQPTLAPMPLLVFVQGSAWTTPNRGFEIPMLSHIAEAGWTVATVSHRDITKGAPFPAFLLDVKCAIRFLRAHAAEYAIDPERVTIWGTSSGGNTALLVGLTGDDPELKTAEYAGESDAVKAVVSTFGPTNLNALFVYLDNPQVHQMLMAAFGPDDSRWQDEMRRWSPVCRVEKGKAYPPFLLQHGTADPVVPVAQMDEMYTVLKEAGVHVEAQYVDGAQHEGAFWTPATRQTAWDFIQKNT